MAAQLEAVGIEVEVTAPPGYDAWDCGRFDVLQVANAFGWATWTLPKAHGIWDPGTPMTSPDNGNVGRWGTGAVEGVSDDPATEWVDESCYNMGPSAVVDEHTERMAEVLDQMGRTIDPDRLRPLIAEAEEILADQVVFIPLYLRPHWMMWNTDLVDYQGWIYAWRAEEWYRADPGD